MKKTLGACVCALTLMGLVGQAEAAPISDWTLTTTGITLTAIPNEGGLVSEGSGGSVDWLSKGYQNNFAGASLGSNSGTLPNTGDMSSIGIDSIGSLSSMQFPLGEMMVGSDGFDLFTLSFTFTLASADNSVKFEALTYDFKFSSSYVNGQETISITSMGFQGEPTTFYEVGDYQYWIGGVNITNSLFAESDSGTITQLVLNNDVVTSESDSSIFTFGTTVDFGAEYIGEPPAATPEPATMLLMGLGLAGLGFVARRRNR